jgi:hypothetical protein
MNSTGQTTIVGEGGTTTTSVQQGLVKAWADYTTSSSGNSINGSFNIGSTTDIGQGDIYLNFTNNMSDVNYSGWASNAASGLNHIDDQATNRQRTRTYSSFTDTADFTHNYMGIAGDLA